MAKATIKRSASQVVGPKVASKRSSVRRQVAPGNGVDARIIELADWRGEMLARVRLVIMGVDRTIAEEVKWRKPSNGMAGVPVWSLGGIICTGETYRNVVKLTFPKGASLPDPAGLFNAGLEGGTRRAIDLHEGDVLDARAFKTLVRAAVALNGAAKQGKTAKKNAKRTVTRARPSRGR